MLTSEDKDRLQDVTGDHVQRHRPGLSGPCPLSKTQRPAGSGLEPQRHFQTLKVSENHPVDETLNTKPSPLAFS